jgi:hypothetical protein
MNKSEYLEKHHSISEQTLGSAHLFLTMGKSEQALREVETGIGELDKLSEYYKMNSVSYMGKVVDASGEWKKEGGLYRSWKLGIRSLKEAFDIMQAKDT